MTPSHTERPKHSRDPISLLLPVHNAAGKLAATVDGWRKTLDAFGREYEILVVDDGSSDATAHEALAIVAKYPAIRTVRHDVSRGFGAALRTGLSETTHPNVVYAGPGYDPGDLKRLIDQLNEADLASGFRTAPVPGGLRAVDGIYRWAVRVLFGVVLERRTAWRGWADWRRSKRLRWQFGIRLDDPLCDFKAFRREPLRRIKLQSEGDFAHAELIAKANFLGCLLAQVPVVPPVRQKSLRDEREYAADSRRVFRSPTFEPLPAREEQPIS